MHITPLASGSQGNSLLLRAGGQVILVDIGLPLAEIEARLRLAGTDPRTVTAVCMTHKHKDHARGVVPFCKEYAVPIYGTRRTLRALCNRLRVPVHAISTDRPFRIGALEVRAVELSHDAPQTVAYTFRDGAHRFGMATDLGCASAELGAAFAGLDALLLEFNHDADMLARGPYPRQLRDRIASDRGHLSNAQAAALLARLDRSRLRFLWLAHLSERNNDPDLACTAARGALGLGYEGELVVAGPYTPAPACDLDRTPARPET